MYDSKAIQEVEKILDDIEVYRTREYKRDVSISLCDEDNEIASFKSTMCDLELLMGELKLMNSAVKEMAFSSKISELHGQRKEVYSSDYSCDDIPGLERFIDKMSNRIEGNSVKRSTSNMIVLYERMLYDLKSEILYLRQLNTTTNSVYKEEILNLKEDLKVKNGFIKDLLSSPVSNLIPRAIDSRLTSLRYSRDTSQEMLAKRKHRNKNMCSLDTNQLETLTSMIS